MPNLSLHGQHEWSTGLQLKQMVQKYTAISTCCLTRSHIGAKNAVIPPILDGKYSSVEKKIVVTT